MGDLPNGLKYVQWQVENIDDLVVFLEPFVCRLRRALGDQLLVQSIGGSTLQLSPGDLLVIEPATIAHPHDRLGVVRSPVSHKWRETETLEPSHIQH